jgi:heterodisulfide reductase subunit A-like polyferredoxin
MYEVQKHPNITLLTNCEVKGIGILPPFHAS